MPEHIVNHYDGWDLIPKGMRISNADKFPDLIKSINPEDKPLTDGLTEDRKEGEIVPVPKPAEATKAEAAAPSEN